MNKNKLISIIFACIAILLSDVMCAFVAYNYRDYLYCIAYKGYSAPAWVTLFYSIPFLLAIIVSITIAIIFYKSSKRIP